MSSSAATASALVTASTSANGSVQSSSVGGTDDSCKPLWRYVKRQERDAEGSGGGNISWECNFCYMQKTTSYIRVRAHLLKLPRLGIANCKKVSSKDIVDMQRLEEEIKNREMTNAPKKVSLPPSSMFPGGMYAIGYESKKRKEAGSSRQTNHIEKSFNLEAQIQLHALIARFFHASGLPFHLARSPYYVSMFLFACNNNLSSYLPPRYNMLRTALLQQEKANVE